jgi:dipeptidyl aminopeptidase/acylaminoacyl peptidase
MTQHQRQARLMSAWLALTTSTPRRLSPANPGALRFMSPNPYRAVSALKDFKGHPANRDLMLRLMPAAGGKPEVLTRLFGGQGTINVPSWSPDGRKVAFVSHQLR